MTITIESLDAFTRAYIETALWSSTDDDGEPLDGLYTIDDIAQDTFTAMIGDCRRFQADNADDIASDPARAGYDFWLTRNGHGAGFWDGDWPQDAGQRLTVASHVFGPVDLHVGDDGYIYQS